MTSRLADRLGHGQHLPRAPGTSSGGDRADRQHPGQAEIHPGELRRVQALAQVAD